MTSSPSFAALPSNILPVSFRRRAVSLAASMSKTSAFGFFFAAISAFCSSRMTCSGSEAASTVVV